MPQALPPGTGPPVTVSGELEIQAGAPLDRAGALRPRLLRRLPPAGRRDAWSTTPYQWLLLPWGHNPRALAEPAALRLEADPAQRVQAVLDRFARDRYVYTLQPPLLGRDASTISCTTPAPAFASTTPAPSCS
jgi:hypothetical protein